MSNSISQVITQTMTLKEITDLLDVRHRDAMKVVAKMANNQEFGTAAKISLQYKKGNNALGIIQTYQLDKRQSLAVAARLNTTLMMRVIDRLEQLEQIASRIPPQLQRYTERVATVPIKHFIALEIVTLELTIKLAKQGHDMFKEMMPEGSFVFSWNKVLRSQGENIESFPTHAVYTNYGKQVGERCYPVRLRESAYNHFWDTWMPEKAPKYLKQRQPELLPVIPVVINDLQNKLNAYLLPAPQGRLF